MLRIKYTKGKTPFEFRRIDRSQCQAVIKSFLSYWTREVVKDESGNETERLISPSEFVAEWQDGNGDWDEKAKTEKIPTC